MTIEQLGTPERLPVLTLGEPTRIFSSREPGPRMAVLLQQLYQREIAEPLFISRETVKTHVQHLYRKLNARTRRQAITNATAWGILS